MKVLELIRNRRSLRTYKKEKIDISIIDRILEAARWAPSGLNNQPWKFLMLSGKEKKTVLQSIRNKAE